MPQASGKTPLERIVGDEVAEDAYDRLSLNEQVIVDLVITGWTQNAIADVLRMSQPGIARSIRRISIKLAESKLKRVLEARQYYRETNINNTSSF
ncbi:MAG TPA: hypothetical protein VNX65_02355 [Patescibacteria group bacterium]|jgi:hypothetical protein|nr:hypothetical protein [Patescibacteria group bacterium]